MRNIFIYNINRIPLKENIHICITNVFQNNNNNNNNNNN